MGRHRLDYAIEQLQISKEAHEEELERDYITDEKYLQEIAMEIAGMEESIHVLKLYRYYDKEHGGEDG